MSGTSEHPRQELGGPGEEVKLDEWLVGVGARVCAGWRGELGTSYSSSIVGLGANLLPLNWNEPWDLNRQKIKSARTAKTFGCAACKPPIVVFLLSIF